MKHKYIAALAVAMSMTFASCGNGAGTAQTDNDKGHQHTDGESSEVELSDVQLRTVDITLGHIERKELGSAIHANGMLSVNPQDVADVAPLTPGIVTRMDVVEGRHVKAGQPVAYIENTDIITMQQNYLAASDELTLATQEYDRQKALDEQGAGVKKNLQQAQTALRIARTNAEGLSAQLRLIGLDPATAASGKIADRVPVKAPISGIVSKISVNTGGFVDMQTPIMTIVDNNAVYCRLNIFEKDIEFVKPGQKVDIRLTNRQNTGLSGTVDDINYAIDSDSKAIVVRVKLTDPAGESLVPGMAVTALINTGKETVDALPEDAVVSSAGKSYIFVVEDIHDEDGHKAYHFKKVEVKAGTTEMGYTPIIPSEAIGPDTQVVTSNAFYLASMTADHGEHSH